MPAGPAPVHSVNQPSGGRLGEQLPGLPNRPGVYLMKDGQGGILYVGKARSLRDRVRSYFQKGANLMPRIRSMIFQVEDLEYLVTRSDLEALVLENNLIKKHRPKYNILLRDDKSYPFLRLALKEDYPRLQIVRRVKRDGALYYGPYVPTYALRKTLRVLRRIFPLPNCRIKIDGTADRACIEYEIKRCLAPCTGFQSREQYQAMIRQVKLFLEGKDRDLIDQLEHQMEAASDRLDFEEAAQLRDTIDQIRQTLEKQRVTTTDLRDQDVLWLVRKGSVALLQVLFVRSGMVVGRKDHVLEDVADAVDEELYRSVIQQFYAREGLIPSVILMPLPLGEKELLERWLSEKRGSPVRLGVPLRGKNSRLLDLARENALVRITEHLGMQKHGVRALEDLQKHLRLNRLPGRVEAFDISNIAGIQAVGSLVVFEGGRMDRSQYRRFRIRTVQGANDFAMLQEVLLRHYRRVVQNGWVLPDLILVDGGKGQLSIALQALERLSLKDIPVIGMAKARGDRQERVFLPGRSHPCMLPLASPGMHLLQRVRDEAHRFAVTYHRKLRGKEMTHSVLDAIDGIGVSRKQALLLYFGGLDRIHQATLEELEAVPEMGKVLAHRIFERLSVHAADM